MTGAIYREKINGSRISTRFLILESIMEELRYQAVRTGTMTSHQVTKRKQIKDRIDTYSRSTHPYTLTHTHSHMYIYTLTSTYTHRKEGIKKKLKKKIAWPHCCTNVERLYNLDK